VTVLAPIAQREAVLRALVHEPALTAASLVAPLFVMAGDGPPVDISSMPGVRRLNLADTLRECEALAALGIRAVALFPVIASTHKDDAGSYARRRTGFSRASCAR